MPLLLKDFLVLTRPYKWVNNGFVLIGLLFGHAWSDLRLLKAAQLDFATFCLASSSVYVFNGMIDCEADRLHLKKNTARLLPAGFQGVW